MNKDLMKSLEEFCDDYMTDYNQSEIETIDILQEECSELIQALSKYKRTLREGKAAPIKDIAEEMAHVLISIGLTQRQIGARDCFLEHEVEKKADKFGIGKNSIGYAYDGDLRLYRGDDMIVVPRHMSYNTYKNISAFDNGENQKIFNDTMKDVWDFFKEREEKEKFRGYCEADVLVTESALKSLIDVSSILPKEVIAEIQSEEMRKKRDEFHSMILGMRLIGHEVSKKKKTKKELFEENDRYYKRFEEGLKKSNSYNYIAKDGVGVWVGCKDGIVFFSEEYRAELLRKINMEYDHGNDWQRYLKKLYIAGKLMKSNPNLRLCVPYASVYTYR